MAETQQQYGFNQPPKAVLPRQRRGFGNNRYRHSDTSNIMFDRRVVRGNTYAAQVVPANAAAEADRLREEQIKENKKRDMMEARRRGARPPGTPEPIPGRRHIDVQTENFLEELTDKVPEVDEETQTEAFMDRPPSPLFMPSKIGVDVETQIAPGDLFDFNREVVPILEVLVGKTLVHSMMEVLEEEELANIRSHQAEFQQMRNAELAEVQRMEAETRRKEEEKQRRVAQEKLRINQEEEVRDKVAARSYAKNYLTDLQGNVFDKLTEQGHFFDPLVRNDINRKCRIIVIFCLLNFTMYVPRGLYFIVPFATNPHNYFVPFCIVFYAGPRSGGTIYAVVAEFDVYGIK